MNKPYQIKDLEDARIAPEGQLVSVTFKTCADGNKPIDLVNTGVLERIEGNEVILIVQVATSSPPSPKIGRMGYIWSGENFTLNFRPGDNINRDSPKFTEYARALGVIA